MAWEYVLVNIDGQNWWQIRPKSESQQSESSCGGFFEIQNATSEVVSTLYNGMSFNSNLYVSGGSQAGKSSINLYNEAESLIFTDYTNNSSDLTISFWVYPTSVSGNDRFLFSSRNGSDNCWSILRDGSDWKVVYTQSNTQSVSLATVDSFQWQHIAVSWNIASGVVSLYKNGSLEGTQSGASPSPACGQWTIGGKSNDGVSMVGYGFLSHLSSISFHESVLLADEVAELYNSSYNADLTSDFGNYQSSSSLALSILGGAGNYRLREDYPSSYHIDSYDVQNLFNYSLDVPLNTSAGTPYFNQGDIDYVNNFPND